MMSISYFLSNEPCTLCVQGSLTIAGRDYPIIERRCAYDLPEDDLHLSVASTVLGQSSICFEEWDVYRRCYTYADDIAVPTFCRVLDSCAANISRYETLTNDLQRKGYEDFCCFSTVEMLLTRRAR